MAEDVGSRLARVDAVLDELRREVVELRAENELLRSHAVGPARGEAAAEPEPAAPVSIEGVAGAAGLGRRRLLLGGATATVAAAAAVVGSGAPAAAANDGNLVLGNSNNGASNETALAYSGTYIAKTLS